MLKNLPYFEMLLCNLVIIGLWHVSFFFACMKLPNSLFSPSRARFSAKPWEHRGRWYRDNLKIQVWKDRLPQYIRQDGFSKKNLTDTSVEYLDRFILETCRGEWIHKKNCLCIIITLLINPPVVGIVASFFIMIANVPFAMVQRYNRFRLQILREKRIRDLRNSAVRQHTVIA